MKIIPNFVTKKNIWSIQKEVLPLRCILAQIYAKCVPKTKDKTICNPHIVKLKKP